MESSVLTRDLVLYNYYYGEDYYRSRILKFDIRERLFSYLEICDLQHNCTEQAANLLTEYLQSRCRVETLNARLDKLEKIRNRFSTKLTDKLTRASKRISILEHKILEENKELSKHQEGLKYIMINSWSQVIDYTILKNILTATF